MTEQQRRIRQHIRAFLLTATLNELQTELQISIDKGDTLRADCIRELIREHEQEGA